MIFIKTKKHLNLIYNFINLKTNYCQRIISNPAIRDFLANINKVLIYKTIACLLLAIVVIISARVLTQSEFGHVGIVNNISYLLFVPMILGIHGSMYKFLPISSKTERKELIFFSALISLITISLFSILLWNLSPSLTMKLNISHHIWKIGIIMTVLFSFTSLSESYLRGQRLFDDICIFKLVSSITNLLLILIFYFGFNQKKLECYLLSTAISYVLFTALAMFKIKLTIPTRVNWAMIKKIYTYGINSSLNMFIGGFIFISDIFFVNYFCSPETVGLYNAYQGFLKNIFSVLFYEVFLVVFLPFIAQSNNNQLMKQKVKVYIPIILIIVIAGSGLANILFLKLFGERYQLNYLYLALSSLSIALYTIYQINLAIYIMEGNRSTLITGFTIFSVSPFILYLQFICTKYWNMIGTLVSIVLTNLVLIISMEISYRYLSYKFKKYFNQI